ncbi:Afadin and alpha-actinin-binding-domain-containing protein [Elsinoe ampelina]|uniref:Afadin and alpha-actinin-binding-domain-containing protein n=1 Tax=Elsinoe ampelina TaxID=302913 RepID=A0A6A6FZJ4_9PEZI|nr:Afadin and alpha-actinin-binding-domain-containing protein [Elsinoe ampelina]
MAMESETLITASTYVNNLLLARGLLRNGKSVDFAKPTRETRAQIINLVHDLLLRRDKDEDGREQAADIIRSLRIENTRKDSEIERLQNRLAEKERALTQAQVDARNAKADLKKVQISVKTLQTQLAKTKTLAEQIKAQCTADLRKRDLQIEKLKSHLQGQQRGNKSLVVAPSISINGGSRSQPSFNMSLHSLADPEYTLKQETNEFLTQLSQSLSDENDGLLSLVRNTLQTLQDLLGIPRTADVQTVPNSGQPVYESIAIDMETVMDTLRNLLTNPNFVSVEEVDIRDEEIGRLREGWEMMEARWKDVLVMMDGWRKRLERTGDTINLDDLKRGLGLDAGFEEIRQTMSPSRLPRPSMHGGMNDEDSTEAEIVSRDSGVSGLTEEETPSMPALPSPVKQTAVDPPEFFDLRPAKAVQGQQLRQLSSNIQSPRRLQSPSRLQSPKRVAFEPPQVDSSEVLESLHQRYVPTPELSSSDVENRSLDQGSRTRSGKIRKPVFEVGRSQTSARKTAVQVEPPQSSSFLEEDVPQMTMQDKLRAAQSEAEEALNKPIGGSVMDSELELEMNDDIGALRSPAKKTKIKGRPKRRKSTLSPEELESLLGLD